MIINFDPYLASCLLAGFACGLESHLAGRKLAIATHLIAALFGYYGLGATDMVALGLNGFAFKILYALGALFLVCAWIAECDSLRNEDRPAERGDAANHVIAFAIGLACAIQCETLTVVACAEMYALYLRRRRGDSEPAYANSAFTAAAPRA
mgnify:FL=1